MGNISVTLAQADNNISSAGMMNNRYCMDAGVTGINDGTRDDAPGLATAYAAAVAAGSLCLVLPVGKIYIKSRTTDAVYPYDYVIRNTVNNFVFVIPNGCEVHVTDAGPSSATYASVIQLAGAAAVTGAKAVGGGRFVHDLGYAANNWGAVYAPAACVDCKIDNLHAEEFGSTNLAAFDSSASSKGTLSNLKTIHCFKSIAQSSTQAGGTPESRGHRIFNLDIKNHVFAGLICNGIRNSIQNVTVDCSAITPVNSSAAIMLGGSSNGVTATASGGTTLTNLRLIGNPVTGSAGILIQNGVSTDTLPVTIKNIVIAGYETGIAPGGMAGALSIDGLYIQGFTYGIWKTALNSVNCTQTVIKNATITSSLGTAYGLLGGGGVTDAAQGTYLLENVTIVATTAKYWNTVPTIASAVNCTPMPLISQLTSYQRSTASSGTVTANVGINGLTLLLTAAATTLTVVFPTSPIDGQVFRLRSEAAVTTLTVTGTVAGSPVTLAAGYDRTFIYDNTATTWS